jgi:hypothetical protein
MGLLGATAGGAPFGDVGMQREWWLAWVGGEAQVGSDSVGEGWG